MFTGIIEEIGTVRRVQRGPHSARLENEAALVLADAKPGDSIAVNGVCLTAAALSGDSFFADVMHETLDRSDLASLSSGSHVNLERAMRADGRFGGHIVAGHIDGVGRITDIRRDDNAVWFTIAAGPGIMRYIVEKGSIAVDGISLTVASVTGGSFSVSTIPETMSRTALRERRKGDKVNLETDIIGKYVERFVTPAGEQKQSGLTREFLETCGFTI